MSQGVEFVIPKSLWLTSNRHITNRSWRASIVRDLHALAHGAASLANLPTASGPVRATWTVRYPKGVSKKADASNAQPTTKALLDGLVPTWLPDDSAEFVLSETFQRGPNRADRLHSIHLTLSRPDQREDHHG